MAEITSPPDEIKQQLLPLRAALDESIPAKVLDHNLLIATWNIRAFGGLTDKWQAGKSDSPRRDLESLLCIAEIVSRFDVIALQEVKGNIKALRHLLKALGSHWGMILTDVTRGDAGNGERLAFLFDTRKVQLAGLACELVIPQEELNSAGDQVLQQQFARTPYAVSFRSSGKTFILVTLHVLYGSNPAQRAPELKAIASWLANWSREIHSWGHNLIVLGDFNIDRKGDALYDAFTSTGLEIPSDLHPLPRTIFSNPDQPDTDKFYDQIAWFTDTSGSPALSLEYLRGGNFDFTGVTLQARDLTRARLSWHISDHYPLWTEFAVRK